MRGKIRKIIEEGRAGGHRFWHGDMPFTEEQVKLFQYVMLTVLLAAAMILPGYGLKKHDARTAAGMQAAAQKPAESGSVSGQTKSGSTSGQASVRSESGSTSGQTSVRSESGGVSGQTSESDGTWNQAAAGQADSGAESGGPTGNENAGSGAKGTIVLDPGHGGSDPGMVGVSGISEKVLNLVYAKKLAALLEADGYRVVLTRTTEDGLYDADEPNKKAQDMQRRCALIEQEQPLLTVSIHQNSYPADASVRGPQVFYYQHSAEGQKLAVLIQDCMNEQLEIARPRVQKANGSYYILKRSAGTTALVEFGFLTNPQEEALLQDEDYQDRAVRAVRDGILLYLGETAL